MMPSNKTPFFSVVIPLYNKEKYIARAIQSIFTQEFSDFEVIVVNDGSTDSSARIVQELSDRRIKLLEQANSGVGSARNTGLQAAKGQYVAFLDADDMWLPHHLAALHKISNHFPEAALIGTGNIEIKQGEEPDFYELLDNVLPEEVNYLLEASKKVGFINASSVAIKSDVINGVGLFKSYKTGEDLEYWLRIALSYKVAVCRQVTSLYYRDTSGVMISMEKSVKATIIKSQSDLSPSIATIFSEYKENHSLLNREDIRAYITARALNGIKGNVYLRNFENAWQIASLFSDFLPKLFLVQCMILKLPRCLLNLALDMKTKKKYKI